ncbi:type VII toxin-antitoxin system HepT family RNase toxin [Desulfofundulus thermobenzoicus]
MGLDRERIMAKIGYIKEQVASIGELLKSRKKEDILMDPWLVRGLKYSMQTAVEAMIDLAYHIAAKKFGHAPGDARDAMRILLEGGLITRDRLTGYSAMIGFRNRVIHGYQEVSAEKVYEMARNELGDFEQFICEIGAVLEDGENKTNDGR